MAVSSQDVSPEGTRKLSGVIVILCVMTEVCSTLVYAFVKTGSDGTLVMGAFHHM